MEQVTISKLLINKQDGFLEEGGSGKRRGGGVPFMTFVLILVYILFLAPSAKFLCDILNLCGVEGMLVDGLVSILFTINANEQKM